MRRLWIAFTLVMFVSFLVLGWVGTRIYNEMPPIPDRVVTTTGEEVIGLGDIQKGQNVWQTLGGMQVGSIWGHGSYVAPDWSADYLHREAMFILNQWAEDRIQERLCQLEFGTSVAIDRSIEGSASNKHLRHNNSHNHSGSSASRRLPIHCSALSGRVSEGRCGLCYSRSDSLN